MVSVTKGWPMQVTQLDISYVILILCYYHNAKCTNNTGNRSRGGEFNFDRDDPHQSADEHWTWYSDKHHDKIGGGVEITGKVRHSVLQKISLYSHPHKIRIVNSMIKFCLVTM